MKLNTRLFAKASIVALLTIIGAAVLYQNYLPPVSQNPPTVGQDPEHERVTDLASRATSSKATYSESKPEPVDAKEKKTQKADALTPSQFINNLLSKDEALEMVAWQEERGYPSYSLDGVLEESQYKHYDDQTLESLARSGDAEAMLVLARRVFFESGNYEKARSLYYEASAHGYTITLAELGNLSISRANQSLKQDRPAEAREYFKDAYAWFETGIMRGDKAIEVSKNAYGIEFTDAELDEIMHSARHYYSDLSRKREEMGYPPFDNDYPIGLDIVYSHMFSN